jgi:hypothetical protein
MVNPGRLESEQQLTQKILRVEGVTNRNLCALFKCLTLHVSRFLTRLRNTKKTTTQLPKICVPTDHYRDSVHADHPKGWRLRAIDPSRIAECARFIHIFPRSESS